MTIGENLAATAVKFPDVDAVVDLATQIRLSYRQFDDEVTALARSLLIAGLRPGDRIGLWSPNRYEWVLLQFASARAGVILVNVNPAYRTHELTYAVNQSGSRWLLAPRSYKTSNYQDMIESCRSEMQTVERVVYFETDEWQQLRDLGLNSSMDITEFTSGLHFHDPINIQYTSGTTGFPKGATLTHFNILNNGYLVGELCGYTERDRVCIPVPFYHCFGMVMGNLACASHGATMVIPAPTFDAASTLEAVEKEKCTSLYGVPTMFIAELEHEEFAKFDLTSLRTGIMAGSPCPVEVMKMVIDRMNMGEVTICYGMTETSPVSTQTRLDDTVELRVATVGRVHPHVEIKVVDPATGDTVERGETGEFCTRGYSVMKGYWNDEERTRDVLDSDGWMHTGDLAIMQENGYLNIVGRIKDMVIRGGENIYPREIEEFYYQHPDVSDVQVIGVPDLTYGEELCAWIRRRAGSTITAEELREFARGKLAHFKIPRYIEFVEEFPTTVTGKVQKFKMRAETIERLGLEDAAQVRNA
jgi:fatty-acyl-CoA synthase